MYKKRTHHSIKTISMHRHSNNFFASIEKEVWTRSKLSRQWMNQWMEIKQQNSKGIGTFHSIQEKKNKQYQVYKMRIEQQRTIWNTKHAVGLGRLPKKASADFVGEVIPRETDSPIITVKRTSSEEARSWRWRRRLDGNSAIWLNGTTLSESRNSF